MITVVDYGIGNLGSVLKAFRHLGVPVALSDDPAVLGRAEALVLPGDGAFGATMDEVERRGLVSVLRQAAAAGTPLLGICVGMQLLFEESEEHGRHAGLGLLPGRVRRFPGPLPVPHMGWNQLSPRAASLTAPGDSGAGNGPGSSSPGPHPLLAGIAEGEHVYFVHSYFCDAEAQDVLAWSDYGGRFPAVVGRGSVLGMQFHPEKSQAVGLRLVTNFVKLVGVEVCA